ncbi:MAG: molybdenum cofactor guanylyltransferase [Acidimicrobiales bacterium]
MTGGTSRRMGQDKASMVIEGQVSARRIGALLAGVAHPALEVGPGHSDLEVVGEHNPGQGPLVAVAEGWEALVRTGHGGDVLVVACDLVFLTRRLLVWLSNRPESGSVIPVVEGRPQPLCARWSPPDLDRLVGLVQGGHRSFKSAYDHCPITFLDEQEWGHAAQAIDFADVDSPEDLHRLGLG